MCTQSVTEETFAVLGGLLFFQDYHYFEDWGASLFAVGQSLSVISVVLLSHFRLEVAQQDQGTMNHNAMDHNPVKSTDSHLAAQDESSSLKSRKSDCEIGTYGSTDEYDSSDEPVFVSSRQRRRARGPWSSSVHGIVKEDKSASGLQEPLTTDCVIPAGSS
eukprot:TRINITY_DN16376_c0_g1_i3.p1 TRINITY_DN16376_c0_g1~~TRINITY_DN16376_c0_g1_i3.p1  ORF type:complete len:161 (+),score=26.91 TRINITY_DN16376_c0_g1_i3:3-485(+)